MSAEESAEEPKRPWNFPSTAPILPNGLSVISADLEPATVIDAYRLGYFPMPIELGGPIGWWSPDPRGVLELDALKISRSLQRSLRRFEIRVNSALPDVIAACARPNRDGGWIDNQVLETYARLGETGLVHSVESWLDGELAGGLYGVAVGGLFAGESMFSYETDASKVALVRLVDLLRDGEMRLIDVQWATKHLASLGAIAIPRKNYLERLPALLESPLPKAFAYPYRSE